MVRPSTVFDPKWVMRNLRAGVSRTACKLATRKRARALEEVEPSATDADLGKERDRERGQPGGDKS